MAKFVGIREAIELLSTPGELVAIPTETVYGLAGLATSVDSIRKIFEVKGRPPTNPLILHFGDISTMEEFVEFPDYLKPLQKFWPGPFTIVLPKKKDSQKARSLPQEATAKLDTCAVRIPSHPLTLELLRKLGKPLAAPSANPSGKRSPTDSQMVEDLLGKKISGILDGGVCRIGIESTIVAPHADGVMILRHGGITKNDINSLGIQVYDSGYFHETPGSSSHHYAPSVPLILLSDANINFDSAPENKIKYLKQGIPIETKKVHYIAFDSKEKESLREDIFHSVVVLSKKGDIDEAAHNLFRAFSRIPEDASYSCAREFPQNGIGIALNDRLKRSSSYIGIMNGEIIDAKSRME